MNQATVDGTAVFVGSYVNFKSDIEQGGYIVQIKRNCMGQVELTLEDEDGFSGDYIGGDTRTSVLATDCWLEW